MGYLPKRFFWAHTIWSWIWFLSFPAGVITLFFNVGIGLLIFFFVSFLGGKAVNRSAVEFVLEHALEDEGFFSYATRNGIIIIEEISQEGIQEE